MNEAANARSPLNDPTRSAAQVVERMEKMGDDGREYKMPFGRTDQFNSSLPHSQAQAPGHQMTPM